VKRPPSRRRSIAPSRTAVGSVHALVADEPINLSRCGPYRDRTCGLRIRSPVAGLAGSRVHQGERAIPRRYPARVGGPSPRVNVNLRKLWQVYVKAERGRTSALRADRDHTDVEDLPLPITHGAQRVPNRSRHSLDLAGFARGRHGATFAISECAVQPSCPLSRPMVAQPNLARCICP
jgi:hypothetical protein